MMCLFGVGHLFPNKNGWRVLLSILSTCSLGVSFWDFSNYHATISVVLSYELANLIAMPQLDASHVKLLKFNGFVVKSDVGILIVFFLLAIFGYTAEQPLNWVFGSICFRLSLFIICALDFPVVWATRGATFTDEDEGTFQKVIENANERRPEKTGAKRSKQDHQVAYNERNRIRTKGRR